MSSGAMLRMPPTRASNTEGTSGKVPDITPYSTERSITPKQNIGTSASLKAEGKSSPVTLKRMAWGTNEKNEITAIYTSTVTMLKRKAARWR